MIQKLIKYISGNSSGIQHLIFRMILLGVLVVGCKSQPAEPQGSVSPDSPSANQLQPEPEDMDNETTHVLKRHGIDMRQWAQSGETPSVAAAEETAFPVQGSEPMPASPSGVADPRDPAESPAEVGEPNSSMLSAEVPPEVDLAEDRMDLLMPALLDPNLAEERIQVDFAEADIRDVIKSVSELTGIRMIVHSEVKGIVSVQCPQEIRLGDLFQLFESILEVNGYAAVPAGELVKIVPREQANKRNVRIQFGADPNQIPQDDSIVRQIMPLQYADASEVATMITPFASAQAIISPDPRTNYLLITDSSANVHHMARIIRKLDVPFAQEQQEVIPLHFASAQSLAKQIMEIMAGEKSGANRSRSESKTKMDIPVKVLPDTRTNSLLVIACPSDMQTIRGLVRNLDIQRPDGAENWHVVYLENAQAEELAPSLTSILANMNTANATESRDIIQVTPDAGTNSLIINALPQDFLVISKIIEKLDMVRERVLVELLIVEIDEDSLQEIGVDWATLDQAVSDSVRGFGNTDFGIRADATSGNLEGLSIGAFKKVGGETQIGAILYALNKVSDVNILSTPSITTSNHRKAKIIVGENIPYVKGDRVTETDPSTPTIIRTIDYKDVGISLDITPHVSYEKRVRLEIASEFTQLIDSVTGLSADTPTTAKRQIETEVTLDDGATLVLGGLIRDDKTTVEKKIPLLGDLPLIGGLFKLQRDRLQKTNLLLFITPYVIQNEEQERQITQKKKAELVPELERRIQEDALRSNEIRCP